MIFKLLLTTWLLLMVGLILYAVGRKVYEDIQEKRSIQEEIKRLENKAQEWRALSPESRTLKRVNDSWLEEGFSRQQYTELYNKILHEERRKPSEPFREEINRLQNL